MVMYIACIKPTTQIAPAPIWRNCFWDCPKISELVQRNSGCSYSMHFLLALGCDDRHTRRKLLHRRLKFSALISGLLPAKTIPLSRSQRVFPPTLKEDH
jgi:hypothetical protein